MAPPVLRLGAVMRAAEDDVRAASGRRLSARRAGDRTRIAGRGETVREHPIPVVVRARDLELGVLQRDVRAPEGPPRLKEAALAFTRHSEVAAALSKQNHRPSTAA